jgi:hypothetical protein
MWLCWSPARNGGVKQLSANATTVRCRSGGPGRYPFCEARIAQERSRAGGEISMEDITPELARRSGFLGVVDLMKVAKHGPGRNIYLVTFRYRDGIA